MREHSVPEKPSAVVVDDNLDAAESTAMLLEMLGFATATGGTGATGLALCAAHLPALLLLDLSLPDTDGFQVCRQVRALPGGGAVRIVALSGWDEQSSREQVRGAGFDGYLTKPVDFQQLQTFTNDL